VREGCFVGVLVEPSRHRSCELPVGPEHRFSVEVLNLAGDHAPSAANCRTVTRVQMFHRGRDASKPRQMELGGDVDAWPAKNH
jgi:hypothetical protein